MIESVTMHVFKWALDSWVILLAFAALLLHEYELFYFLIILDQLCRIRQAIEKKTEGEKK